MYKLANVKSKSMTAKAFHDKMVAYIDEYQEHLLLVKPNDIALFHCPILREFVNYIYNHHLVSCIDQITVSMTNSKFHADFKRRNKEVVSKEKIKKILHDYFVYLNGKHGIKNEKMMRGLEK